MKTSPVVYVQTEDRYLTGEMLEFAPGSRKILGWFAIGSGQGPDGHFGYSDGCVQEPSV